MRSIKYKCPMHKSLFCWKIIMFCSCFLFLIHEVFEIVAINDDFWMPFHSFFHIRTAYFSPVSVSFVCSLDSSYVLATSWWCPRGWSLGSIVAECSLAFIRKTSILDFLTSIESCSKGNRIADGKDAGTGAPAAAMLNPEAMRMFGKEPGAEGLTR